MTLLRNLRFHYSAQHRLKYIQISIHSQFVNSRIHAARQVKIPIQMTSGGLVGTFRLLDGSPNQLTSKFNQNKSQSPLYNSPFNLTFYLHKSIPREKYQSAACAKRYLLQCTYRAATTKLCNLPTKQLYKKKIHLKFSINL